MTNEPEIRPKAEQGDADAQYRLAMALWGDEKFSKDEVLEWFQKAAAQGHADAQYQIGCEFLSKENPESKAMLLAAAEQGHPEACMNLCSYYLEFGCDEAEGIRWYRRARELGHSHSAFDLGILTCYVKFPPSNIERRLIKYAYWWGKEAQYTLGTLYAIGEFGFTESMTDAYAWFAIAAGHDPGSPVEPAPKGQSSYVGWGEPQRAVRLLTLVLDEEELAQARDCLFQIQLGVWRRLGRRLVAAGKGYYGRIHRLLAGISRDE